jgi:hypothetical protein
MIPMARNPDMLSPMVLFDLVLTEDYRILSINKVRDLVFFKLWIRAN